MTAFIFSTPKFQTKCFEDDFTREWKAEEMAAKMILTEKPVKLQMLEAEDYVEYISIANV